MDAGPCKHGHPWKAGNVAQCGYEAAPYRTPQVAPLLSEMPLLLLPNGRQEKASLFPPFPKSSHPVSLPVVTCESTSTVRTQRKIRPSRWVRDGMQPSESGT